MSWCVGLCCYVCIFHVMVCRTILCVACVYFMSWCVGLYCVLHVYTSCRGVQDGIVCYMCRTVLCYICIVHVMMCGKTVLCVTCVSSCHWLYYSNEKCLVSLGLDLTITLFDFSQELILEFDGLEIPLFDGNCHFYIIFWLEVDNLIWVVCVSRDCFTLTVSCCLSVWWQIWCLAVT